MSIYISNLSYMADQSRDSNKILDNISLNIENGETVAIIGRTGSGKTTLVHNICGLVMPNYGEIRIDNITIKKNTLNDIRKIVGIVTQFPEHQLFENTVYDDIAFGMKSKGYSKEQIKEKIRSVIQLLEIDENILQKSPFEISDGEKRKVAIAGVLVTEPKVLIFDEPTVGMDVVSRKKFFDLILWLKEKRDKIIITISHDIENILEIADRLIIMNNGKIVFDDKVNEIFKKVGDIEEYGLELPQITTLMRNLKKVLPELKDNIYTINQAKQELTKLLK